MKKDLDQGLLRPQGKAMFLEDKEQNVHIGERDRDGEELRVGISGALTPPTTAPCVTPAILITAPLLKVGLSTQFYEEGTQQREEGPGFEPRQLMFFFFFFL